MLGFSYIFMALLLLALSTISCLHRPSREAPCPRKRLLGAASKKARAKTNGGILEKETLLASTGAYNGWSANEYFQKQDAIANVDKDVALLSNVTLKMRGDPSAEERALFFLPPPLSFIM